MADITSTRVLILATDGFEQSELFDPRAALMDAGVEVTLASVKTDPIQGMRHDEPGETITPDLTLGEVQVADYDALLLPGGVANPDALRLERQAIETIRGFAEAGKTIAAICHAPWLDRSRAGARQAPRELAVAPHRLGECRRRAGR